MEREYTFCHEGTIVFDDNRTVKELAEYAFRSFGYYLPFGMEILTVFQGHHPDHHSGWFTTNTSARCADEIKNPKELIFAYHMPGMFYFVEGGFGHHMNSLGNRPDIPDEVSLTLMFEDFNNTVVINGSISCHDVINALKEAGYIDIDVQKIDVLFSGAPEYSYSIYLTDERMYIPLSEFDRMIWKGAREIEEKNRCAIYNVIIRLK